MADLQPGSLPTTFTVGADTDYTLISRGAQTGRMLRSELLKDVPRILPAVVLGGNGVIAAASFANRHVRVITASTSTFTAATAGFADRDVVSFLQEGAGALTLTGDIGLAPGIASATTNGIRSVLDCVYVAALLQLVVVGRSAAAAGGGSAFAQRIVDMAQRSSPAATGVIGGEFDIPGATYNLTAITADSVTTLKAAISATADSDSAFLRLYLGAQNVGQWNFAAAALSADIDIEIFHRGTAAQVVMGLSSNAGEVSFNGVQFLTVNTTGATVMKWTIQKQTNLNRAFSVEVCVIEVQAP